MGTIGKDGSVEVQNMCLDGNPRDLEVGHVFAFPDQCQMLLEEANLAIFSNTHEDLKTASMLYERLIQRLSFLKTIDFGTPTSKLAAAYHRITSTWELTLFPESQLRSILAEAASHLNRLMLGRDMWGHSPDWTPRMSIQFYEAELRRQLDLLKDQEVLLAEYENSLREVHDTQRIIEKGVASMISKGRKAEDEITRLNESNGPLVSSIDSINAVTPRLKEKKASIQQMLKNASVTPQGPPIKEMTMILEAVSTLAGLKPEVQSICGVLKLGLRESETLDHVRSIENQNVRRELIIRQLTTCGDDIDSLKDAYKMNADRSMKLGSTETLILTTKKNVGDLVNKYRNLLPAEWRNRLRADLDGYVALVLTRNEAVLEYNSSLQLLQQAIANRQHAEEQVRNLRQGGLTFNPTLPAIRHWHRKWCISLRLSIMRDLNYQSRAIRYWGLQQSRKQGDPIPLQTHGFLSQLHEGLCQSFNNCLNHYAHSSRNIWPASDEQQGRRRWLTPEELAELKRNGSTCIHISPDADSSTFARQIDIRLNQVRLWLPGADLNGDSLGRKLLTVYMTHLGEVIIQDRQRNNFTFFHDPVLIAFEYDAAKIRRSSDVKTEYAFATQSIEGDHCIGTTTRPDSVAAISPFALWKITIPGGDVNPGLDLGEVTEAYMEFRGTSRAPGGM